MTLEAAGLQLASAPRRAGTAAPAAPERPASHGAPGSAAVFATLRVLLPLVLAGYALLDRGFAWLHVPGTTLFSGEAVLGLGLVAAVLATGHFRVALNRSPALVLLLVFCAWGAARTIPFLRTYGIDAVRDSALWYYSLTAVLVFVLVQAVPGVALAWARRYAVFLVILLLWSPAALLLARGSGGPLVPGSDVPLFAHKPGNIAVVAVTALAFLWLVPTQSLGRRARSLLTALASLLILAVGTQNRGGLVAALVAITLTIVLARRRRQLASAMLCTVGLGLLLAWGLDVHVAGPSGRDISVGQLAQNLTSVASGSGDTGQLGATVEFRNELWSGVLNLASENGAVVTGLGFGRNLAQDLGLQGQPTEPLRSPHNSHIDVLARMGVVGAVLWLTIWLSWYSVLLRRLLRSPGLLTPLQRGLMGVCVVGVTATLVNAYFDPTLEGPQVALWLWTLVGLGLALASPPLRGAPRNDDTGELTWRAGAAVSQMKVVVVRPLLQSLLEAHPEEVDVVRDQAGQCSIAPLHLDDATLTRRPCPDGGVIESQLAAVLEAQPRQLGRRGDVPGDQQDRPALDACRLEAHARLEGAETGFDGTQHRSAVEADQPVQDAQPVDPRIDPAGDQSGRADRVGRHVAEHGLVRTVDAYHGRPSGGATTTRRRRRPRWCGRVLVDMHGLIGGQTGHQPC